MYYIGIDSSGTYSRLVAVTEDMKVIGRHAGNSTNFRFYSRQIVFENIQKLILEFNKLTNTILTDCASVCIGSAGIDTQKDVVEMETILREIGFTGRIMATHDAELVLATETKGSAGITVIANSGSVGLAIDEKGNRLRCGGWGYLIDDEGSGYNIGMHALKHACMVFDGRRSKSLLYDKIIEHLNIKTIEEILPAVYSEDFNRTKISELALIIKYASENGDKSAKLIENDAAESLSQIAIALIERSKLTKHKVVAGGNVLLLNDSIYKKFTANILKCYKEMKVVTMKEKPEIGAVYLAMNQKQLPNR